MKPGFHELTIYCGSTLTPGGDYFDYLVGTTPVDLSGQTAVIACCDKNGSELFRWSTADGTLEITPLMGRIGLNVSATATAALQVLIRGTPTKFDNGMPLYTVGGWSLELDNAGVVTRLLHGPLLLSPEHVYG